MRRRGPTGGICGRSSGQRDWLLGRWEWGAFVRVRVFSKKLLRCGGVLFWLVLGVRWVSWSDGPWGWGVGRKTLGTGRASGTRRGPWERAGRRCGAGRTETGIGLRRWGWLGGVDGRIGRFLGVLAPADPGPPEGGPGSAGARFGAFWGQVCAVRWPLEGRLGLGDGWTEVGGWTGLPCAEGGAGGSTGWRRTGVIGLGAWLVRIARSVDRISWNGGRRRGGRRGDGSGGKRARVMRMGRYFLLR